MGAIVNSPTSGSMKASHQTAGSVRVDLAGGTLDLEPIHLILPNVITLNLATSLKARVKVEKLERPGVEIESLDYQQTHFFEREAFTPERLRAGEFGPLVLIAWILKEFGATEGLKLTLESGSPPGSGLGGSSAMGVTLARALLERRGIEIESDEDKFQLVQRVRGLEALVLDSGPAGYQDYYPALYGGILALKPRALGLEVEQLFTPELKRGLEEHLLLIHTGEQRHSGINNWEVYKGFFDRKPAIRQGLSQIGEISVAAYQAFKANDLTGVLHHIALEGAEREQLFPGLVTEKMKSFRDAGQVQGMKVCGAGGGGAFLCVIKPEDRATLVKRAESFAFRVLDFVIEPPL